MSITTHSSAEMQAEAQRFLKQLEPSAGGATIVTLSGPLGAGKTTYAQGIARSLGVDEHVTSPTFVIEKKYDLIGQRWETLVHIDAYRLEKAPEIDILDWDALVADPKNLIVLEWPENIAEAVPKDAIRITLTGTGDTRTILYEKENSEGE
jgi:tRNA threonylcarbamoyladenosine biosynthesis protein TsaE